MYFLFSGWFGLLPAAAMATESRTIERMIEDTEEEGQKPLAIQRQERVKLGETYYHRFCIHCHGREGDGDGNTAPYLSPRPRDLSQGLFKFRSTTTNTLPLDEDLLRTIKRGIPGTAMPAWEGVFSDEVIRALVEYIKVFSDRFEFEKPDFVIQSGLEPPFNSLSIEAGEKLYRQLRCLRCHGEKGEKQGLLDDRLKDSWGHPSMVYNLRLPGLYKSGASSKDIYRTLASGMDGTAMSSYDYLIDEERWHLAHFLQSRFQGGDEGFKRPLLTGRLISRRVNGNIDTAFENPVWQSVPVQMIPLIALKARDLPAEGLSIQSVHNGEQIAFRLGWEDSTSDGPHRNPGRYLDAVALQFPMQSSSLLELPFFGMGERDKPVNIWHWKADAQQSIFAENGGGDSSGSPERLDPRQGIPKTIDPFREAAVEEINAEGFGTLSVQSLEDQQLTGEGRWRNGVWEVIFVRDLTTPGPWDVRFESPGAGHFSVALWDGTKRDRNANKRVSLWQELTLK